MTKQSSSSLLASLGLAAAMLAVPAASALAQVVVNGNFEQQSLFPSNSYFTTPDGWTISAPNTAGRDSYGTYGPQLSQDGGRYWGVQYLDGWAGYEFGEVASLSQSISGLTVGNTYALSFYSMANHSYLPGETARWAVSFGDSTQYSTVVSAQTASSGGQFPWATDSLQFVATATTQLLSFAPQFIGVMPGVSPMVLNLDGVALTQVSAVPEPASLGMLLSGLLVFGLAARRRLAARA